MRLHSSTLKSILLGLTILQTTQGIVLHGHDIINATSDLAIAVRSLQARAGNTPDLRVLSLGASIVFGVGSSNGNGFRKPLRDALRFGGLNVDMVGTKTNGDFIDNECEATSGAILSEIANALRGSIGYKPNVVVINGGTNDCIRDIDIGNIGSRMRVILDAIWSADQMANTCIFLSTLLPTSNQVGAQNRIWANQQYRQLSRDLVSDGKCIYLADMDPESPDPANGWIALGRDITDDGVHPNDQGHRKMAAVFVSAVARAVYDGRISQAGNIVSSGETGCDKTYGNGIYAGSLTQRGSGQSDGIYRHDSQFMDKILTITSDYDRNQWRFARLFSRDRDDLVGWFEKEPGKHWYGVWRNQGSGKLEKIQDLNPDMFCNPPGVRFIDMNADGLDDLVCIYPNGDLYLAINNGNGNTTQPPSFTNIGFIKSSEGRTQEFIRLADIDGDGRADYCHLVDSGDIYCWRNGWVDDKPAYWQPLGMRFSSKSMGDARGVRFEDINGDGRDDWMWLTTQGRTWTYTNTRSCAQGRLGDGLNVAWRQGFFQTNNDGATHAGLANFGRNDTNLRDRIHFARIYGEPQAFGTLGRQDYVYMEHSNTTSDGKHRFDVFVWKNKGYGASKVEMDGNKYCNMMGHSDGRADYVWTHSTGVMTLYPNAGKKQLSGTESFWGPVQNEIWSPRPYIGKDADRRDIHLVDWDGDGTCDIVYTDPTKNYSPQVWLNGYPGSGRWQWTYIPDAAPQVQCGQKRGLGADDLSVRFARIDGTKRGDYLCIEKNGRVTGFVHRNDGSWENVGQVKYQDGMDRANLRWADVNGDGKDDMIWLDKFSGDGTVFYNEGRGKREDLKGSLYRWRKDTKPSYQGSNAGTCMFYPDLDGNARADMHAVLGSWTNEAKTWFNPECTLRNKIDDEIPGDPILPAQPGRPPPSVKPLTTTSLTSYTTWPSTLSWRSTSVSSNTHDNQSHPILAPWPICWFCPERWTGVILFGLLPGVYPGGPPPPGLPTPFPPITIYPNGDPEYESTSCSARTANQVTYYVSYELDVDGTTTSTKTYSTASSQIIGCRATDTTSTSTTTSQDSCEARFNYDAEYPAGDGEFVARDLAARPIGRAELRAATQTQRAMLFHAATTTVVTVTGTPKILVPRRNGHRTIESIGTCIFPPHRIFMEADYYVLSEYPAAKGDLRSYYIRTQTKRPGAACFDGPVVTKVPEIVGQSVSAEGLAYTTKQPIGKPRPPWVNSDHVFEVKFLDAYLESRLLAGDVTCQQFIDFFVDRPTLKDGSRMEPLKNLYHMYMPNMVQGGFVAMDAEINSWKAQLYDLRFGKPKKDVLKLVQYIEQFGLTASTINHSDLVEMFQKTHQSVFRGFQQLDELITAEKSSNPSGPSKGMSPDWAPRYQKYMLNYLDNVGRQWSATVNDWYATLALQNGGSTKSESLWRTYPPASFQLQSSAMATIR